MAGPDGLFSGQVGDGPGDLDDAGIGTGGKPQPVDDPLQRGLAVVVQGQNRSSILEDISAFVKMPASRNRFRWTSRASRTRFAMAADGSPFRPWISADVSTG